MKKHCINEKFSLGYIEEKNHFDFQVLLVHVKCDIFWLKNKKSFEDPSITSVVLENDYLDQDFMKFVKSIV